MRCSTPNAGRLTGLVKFRGLIYQNFFFDWQGEKWRIGSWTHQGEENGQKIAEEKKNTASQKKLKIHKKKSHFWEKSPFFVQKFNFDFPRKLSIFLGWKTRENVVVLDILAVDNFDFTRKIVKKILDEKLVKMFCQNWVW